MKPLHKSKQMLENLSLKYFLHFQVLLRGSCTLHIRKRFLSLVKHNYRLGPFLFEYLHLDASDVACVSCVCITCSCVSPVVSCAIFTLVLVICGVYFISMYCVPSDVSCASVMSVAVLGVLCCVCVSSVPSGVSCMSAKSVVV